MTDHVTQQRLAELEAKVDHIYRHLTGQEGGTGASIPPMATGAGGVSDRVRTLVASGKLVQAIKQQRAETGQSLSEATAAIEALD